MTARKDELKAYALILLAASLIGGQRTAMLRALVASAYAQWRHPKELGGASEREWDSLGLITVLSN